MRLIASGFSLLLKAVLLCLAFLPQAVSAETAAEAGHGKVAEGTYVITSQQQYGPRKETSELREHWSLRKLGEQGYQLDSRWTKQEPGSEIVKFSTSLDLSPQLHPVRIKGLPLFDSRLFLCDLSEAGIRCEFENEHPRLAVRAPYDLYLPLPWFLASAALRSRVGDAKQTSIRWVVMDRGGPHSALGFGDFTGSAEYQGEETLESAGGPMAARKFLLRAEPFPNWLVWISKRGLLVAADEGGGKTRVRLASYKEVRPW